MKTLSGFLLLNVHLPNKLKHYFTKIILPCNHELQGSFLLVDKTLVA